MLLRAGLPFRRLLLLSLVSGALGLAGAALGVGLSLGPVPLTPLVFGVTAGVFLYVALVDMVRCGAVQRNGGRGAGLEEGERGHTEPAADHRPTEPQRRGPAGAGRGLRTLPDPSCVLGTRQAGP